MNRMEMRYFSPEQYTQYLEEEIIRKNRAPWLQGYRAGLITSLGALMSAGGFAVLGVVAWAMALFT